MYQDSVSGQLQDSCNYFTCYAPTNQHPSTLHYWDRWSGGIRISGNYEEYKTVAGECWVLSGREKLQDNVSLHLARVRRAWRFLGPCQLKWRKVFIQTAGVTSNLPLSSLLGSLSQCFSFTPRLIDTHSAAEPRRYNNDTQQSVCFFPFLWRDCLLLFAASPFYFLFLK